MSRREDLKEWERSRRAEIAMDVVSSVVLAFICISTFSYFLPGMTQIGVGLCVVGVLILWLRTESAYLERRLSEIEALIGNEMPAYYTSGDMVSFDSNPLYEKLEAIERSLERLGQERRY